MKLVDLTHPLSSGMQVFPGDPEVAIGGALTIAENGVDVSALHLGSHSGTHLDAPCHSIEGGRTTSDVPLDELVGEALVLQVPDLDAGDEIRWHHVASQVQGNVPKIVLLATGWDRHFGTERYLDHPVLSHAAADELWARGMRVLAVDTLNPDRTLQPAESFSLPVHELVLGSDGLIVENVRHAAKLPARCTVGFFPLKLTATDGAPVRAVAWL
ncbi:cyclase family protein [Arthrobacter sulfonylureivorans]|uniref:cyclase family protein n=1 Tax=Arthrobacter sulfonylureivorans TaxID=2486855 RepID=UPI0039E2850D